MITQHNEPISNRLEIDHKHGKMHPSGLCIQNEFYLNGGKTNF